MESTNTYSELKHEVINMAEEAQRRGRSIHMSSFVKQLKGDYEPMDVRMVVKLFASNSVNPIDGKSLRHVGRGQYELLIVKEEAKTPKLTRNQIDIMLHLANARGARIVRYVGNDTFTRRVDMDSGEGWGSFKGLNNASLDLMLRNGLVEREHSTNGGRTNYYRLSAIGRMMTDAVRLTAAPKKPRRIYIHPAGR